MKKVLDVNNLENIFDIVQPKEELIINNNIDDEDDEDDDDYEEVETNSYIDEELKDLINTCKEMMDAAKYLLSSAPDAESIAAAASLVSSLAAVMGEFNKAVLMKKRFNEMTKLEKLKIRSREKLAKLRARLSTQGTQGLKIGDGNTFNVQQNNLNVVPFNQEQIINSIIKEEDSKLIVDVESTDV